jgi:flagellar biosynthesis/type III secretory pathway chaperone
MDFRHWLTRHIDRRLDTLLLKQGESLGAILAAIHETKETLMAGVAELEAAIADVKSAVASEVDRVEAVIAALKALPQAPDLQAQVDELESVATALNAVENTPPA